jgi:hypothetical protein
MSEMASGRGELRCASCHQPLDATDRFCRACGLPTLLQAQTLRAVPTNPPGTVAPRPGLETLPDPQPIVRPATDVTRPAEPSQELTTGSVVRVTSPTMATQMALSTVLMVGLIAVFAIAGILLLVLAFRG